MGGVRKLPKRKDDVPPPPKVEVCDRRTITVTFTLDGVEEALVALARTRAAEQIGRAIPDDPLAQEVHIEMTADRDGEDVQLVSAAVKFKFAME